MSIVLYIGNKNASSWSFRAWLTLREKGVMFDERVIDLFASDRNKQLARVSPTNQVPVLVHDDLVVTDSLAIMEYANEAFDGPSLLPEDVRDRARARSLIAWMHSGLQSLRKGMPFEGTFHKNPVAAPDEAVRDAARAAEAWERALQRSDGPYLFGQLTLADLTFVPVIRRLRSHHFPLAHYPRAFLWANELMSRQSVQEWIRDAEALPPVG